MCVCVWDFGLWIMGSIFMDCGFLGFIFGGSGVIRDRSGMWEREKKFFFFLVIVPVLAGTSGMGVSEVIRDRSGMWDRDPGIPKKKKNFFF